jgi:hypothetical protein
MVVSFAPVAQKNARPLWMGLARVCEEQPTPSTVGQGSVFENSQDSWTAMWARPAVSVVGL